MPLEDRASAEPLQPTQQYPHLRAENASLATFIDRRISSLRNASVLDDTSRQNDISNHTPVSFSSDPRWSDSSRTSQTKSLPGRRSLAQTAQDDRSHPATLVRRSDINRFLRKKARRAQIEDEPIRLEAQEADVFVLRPDMRLRRYWDLYMFVCLMYVATVSVFVFSFLGVLGVGSPWFWIERHVDVSFAIDIILNFFTAYDRAGVLVTDRKAIRRHYIRTWFVPDVISAFPWDILGLAIQDDFSKPNILKLPRFIRLVRLIKLIRLAKILRLKQGMTLLEVRLRLKYGHFRLAGLLVSVMLTMHWFACLFFYFGSIGRFESRWVSQEGVPSDLYGRYITALYFSVYTITTIGYGDVVPENTLERSFTTIIMFLGAAVFAYVISQVSNIAVELSETSAHHRRIMDSLTDFARFRRLPDELVYDIRRYFQREHLRQRVAHEKQLLEKINKDLRIKVLKHMYGTQLEHCRLLRDIPSDHLDEVYNSVVERFARKDERLYSEGDAASCFYIILKGVVKVMEGGVAEIDLSGGEIFGEDDLVFNRPRQSSAVCCGYTELVVVPRKAVMRTLIRHPWALKRVRDEEALWLWDKAMHVMEEQMRYTNIAKQLRECGDAYMRERGVTTGGQGEGGRDEEEERDEVEEVEGRSSGDGGGLDDGDCEGAGSGSNGGEGDLSTMEALRAELEKKTRQVEQLECCLREVQKQVEKVFGGCVG